MSALPKTRWSEAEYLAFERESEIKHEFIAGEIVMMSGASRRHNVITVNTVTSLNNQLRERACEIYAADMRVRVNRSSYFYPDVAVVCGEPQFTDAAVDTLVNPVLIIEVLSPSTEKTDRGRKFRDYRTLESLHVYVLIDQESATIECYTRIDSQWVLTEARGLDAVLDLPAVGCTLALADVYNKVTFETETPYGEELPPGTI